MANATASVAVTAFPDGYDNTLSHQWYLGTITVAAGNYPANGIPLTFNTADFLTSNTPTFGEILSASSGYTYRFDPTHQTVRIFVQGAAATDPMAEMTTGAAVPAGVTGDTIRFHLMFRRN